MYMALAMKTPIIAKAFFIVFSIILSLIARFIVYTIYVKK